MNNTNAHIEFTQADIKRYLAGTMSGKERHDIEKAALQDPFLADAIEGYALIDSDDAEQRLATIKNNLQQNKAEAKVVALDTGKNKQWLRIAAAVILIAGVGVLAMYLNNRHGITNNEITKTDLPANIKDKVVAPLANIDSPAPVKELATKENDFLDTKSNTEKINKAIKPVEPTKEKNEFADLQTEKSISSNKPERSQANATIPQSLPEVKQSSVNNVLNGRIVDEAGKPVAAASIQVNRNAYMSDKNGNFQIAVPQHDTVQALVSAVGFESFKANLQPSQQNNITLRQNNQSLSEVVVIGYGTKSKKAFSPSANQTLQELIPNGGWENYEAYLKETIAAAKDSTQTDESSAGTELEITISPDGKPVKVNILNSKNKILNTKISHAIENGPGWVNPSRKQVKKKLVIKLQ